MRAYVKFTVIYRHKEKYTISETCKFLSVSRSGYYDYVKRMDIPAKDLPLAEKIRECQEKCGRTYLKTECIYRTKLKTYEEAKSLIDEYIYFYNHERIQLKTKLTPLEKRNQFVS